ncbi:hypothetical protein [Streptomyces sp. NPDC059850]|uniref:hypothetical protein n=1 Tax=Streptomyces sp. NPDC059850 TaxID=3346970 RepID=UPI0036652567
MSTADRGARGIIRAAGIRPLATGEALLRQSVTRRLLAEFARSAPVVVPGHTLR